MRALGSGAKLTLAAVALVAMSGATTVWAQGEWKAPAEAKAMKNPEITCSTPIRIPAASAPPIEPNPPSATAT